MMMHVNMHAGQALLRRQENADGSVLSKLADGSSELVLRNGFVTVKRTLTCHAGGHAGRA